MFHGLPSLQIAASTDGDKNSVVVGRERAGWEADADMASTIASIRSAGDIFPGYGLLKKRQSQPVGFSIHASPIR